MHTTDARPTAERFAFGENWRQFLTTLDEERIAAAEASLRDMLGAADLGGKRFLDIGSGSGLFSLAARRLGAAVLSFDLDEASVACTVSLRDRYYPGDDRWQVEAGDALDQRYLSSLGQFDVVYAWGVLHHTGNMWRALANVAPLVRPGGLLFIAIYNDQGGTSARWRTVKRLYNRAPRLGKTALLMAIAGYWEARAAVARALRGQNPLPNLASRRRARGMGTWHDLVDWVGGYPFEVAKPDQIFDFYTARGFILRRLTTSGGHGCNQYVFQRVETR